ncbi:MAG TPA: NAD(P)/FAD-dependent oxidoreductase [Gaiella sp.]
MSDERYDVVVVGAGQAGLAIGHFLAAQARRFVILEAADSVGSPWRSRWDSLTLFTPRRYDALPGLAFPGDPDGYPTRDEVVAYIERYAAHFRLPIVLSSPVRSLGKDGDGFVLDAGKQRIVADQVVVATGPFQIPNTPVLAGGLADELFQTHSADYRRRAEIPEGRALVVGGGNTGFQIAKELAASHEVHLAIGSRQTPLPQRLLGRDLFWWLTKLGLLSKTVESRIGRRARSRDTLIGSSPRDVKRHGVHVRPRAVRAEGRTIGFADGSELAVDAVIWATGYRTDHSWIELPIHGDDGRLRHRRGVTDVPGLYFLGLTWQHTRGSALLGFVADDAAFIAGEISRGVEAPHETSDSHAPRAASVAEGV